jgi:hypothetical protein
MASADIEPIEGRDSVGRSEATGLDTRGAGRTKHASRRNTLSLVVILFGSSLLYIAALRPDSLGFYHDDSVYVTTAKALATGEGYRIISLPYEPAQTKYPPFYPMLLSLIWRAWPDFPQNLVAMMLLSVAATVGFLALSYLYLVRRGYAGRWQALVAVGLAAVNWRTVVLATSLYSEMVYALLSVLALHMAEEYEQRQKSKASGVILGVVIGLAFLTRSIGLTLLIAVAGHYVWRRQWKRVLIPVAVGGLFVVGWALWCHLNRTDVQGINVAYYTSYTDYINHVIESLQSQNETSRLAILSGLWVRNILMLTLISPMVLITGIDYIGAQYFGFVSLFVLAGFIRQMKSGLRLLHLYIICYIPMAAFIPFPSYDRYLMPVLPFILLFVITEAERLSLLIRSELTRNAKAIRKASAVFIVLALLILVCAVLYNHYSETYRRLGSKPFRMTASPAAADAEAIKWINDYANPSDVLICYHDPVYYLYTGRKAERSLPMREWIYWQEDQKSLEVIEALIFQIVEQGNGRYLILTSTDYELEDQTGQYRKILDGIIERHADKFTAVFNSRDGHSRILRVNDSK